jgi:hypothetical protein
MPQDQASGAAGNEFGRANAKRLAEALGATLTRPGTNEARWQGRLVALKSASQHTSSIGVTYLMLNRVDEVIAAFEQPDGTFDIFALSSAAFRSAMRPTRSKGPSAGRVGIVRRSVFEESGRHIGAIRLNAR